MQLTLTSEEASVLHEVLDNYVSNLRMAKKVFLERLLDQLGT